jgi:ubiquinone/menaquinone biosynthesis C-methylase UbiE
MSTTEEIREYWDADAATYDNSPTHRPTSAGEMAAWVTALTRLLPPAPARVLDCGAGTGFLSLMAARLGYRVTAVDISEGMLAKLRGRAAAEGLAIEIVEGPAGQPPGGPFDAVMERHVLWTLPDPVAALRAWRDAAPFGRLVVLESVWGGVDRAEVIKARAREALRRARRAPTEHHGQYPAEWRAALPLGAGTSPSRVVEMVSEAGWATPRLERLRDIEWATAVNLPMPERLLGVPPRFVVVAGQYPRA